MVGHEVLKAKLRKEFNRLGVTDEGTQDALTAELNRFAELIIASYAR